MCIVVAKPMNVPMPDVETLRRCFRANPDGAGFMYADGKSVRIRKGYMDFEGFMKALRAEVPEERMTETAMVLHFRIATHGKVQPSCCHPFPISEEPSDLRSTRHEARFGVAHNGVIHGRMTGEDWSDTMDFVAGIMYPLMKMNPNFMHNDFALDLLEDACGSKLAIMDNAGDIVTVGRFYDDNGVKFSNDGYLPLTTRYSSYMTVWDDEGYYEAYEGYAYGDSLDAMIDLLPHAWCHDCLNAEECALTQPICATDNDAEEMCLLFDEEYGETVMEPLALEGLEGR